MNVQHLHLRMEDPVSDPIHPYAVGMTLEAIIIKSADEGWNYTMVGEARLNQLVSLPVSPAVLNDAAMFTALMRSSFESQKMMMDFSGETTRTETEKMTMPALFQLRDYIIHPLTVLMKLTVNDGNHKLPITHQELSERVLSRLGMPWLVKAIDDIGDEA
ncbi:hypothetical protein PsorP6_011175 [Peronosclerospora sorghi]|uniref:Uncharacterized protein n=1 Tax=Peronosclerospora sorghi TaxID=230839 RepID=A0ACC0VW72_9STRA|nr:hypothetical protein PsorP6_011175 [Peronosclerospora sorghi]